MLFIDLVAELVSRALSRYLGDYLDGFDKRQLSLSLFGGHVELNNLTLKASALNQLNLPITVKSGAPSPCPSRPAPVLAL